MTLCILYIGNFKKFLYSDTIFVSKSNDIVVFDFTYVLQSLCCCMEILACVYIVLMAMKR
jgi:hypothetical protein